MSALLTLVAASAQMIAAWHSHRQQTKALDAERELARRRGRYEAELVFGARAAQGVTGPSVEAVRLGMLEEADLIAASRYATSSFVMRPEVAQFAKAAADVFIAVDGAGGDLTFTNPFAGGKL
jgi:hypothetical protein